MEFPELIGSIVLFFIGILAAFLNVTAGGGSSITVPALILLGVEPNMANGTNRLAIMLQNASASASFRNEKIYQTRDTLLYALLTIPGAIVGSIYATEISDEAFRKVIGIVLIGIIVTILLPKSKKIIEPGSENRFSWLIYPGFFILGFYGGFIQIGVGFLIIALIQNTLPIDLIKTNMHKTFAIMSINIPALIIFVVTGNMNWVLGIALAAGTTVGAWWAAKLSVKKGDKFIKYFFVLALIVISIKLLGFV
ncbi:MAG: sulfite exporter TauE/SafE family protein [Thermodesulfobacteriota bacterium]